MRIFLILIPMIAVSILLDMRTGLSLRNANISHGFPYPINGFEHVVALFAVGLIAARYHGRRILSLPATYVLMFATGLSLGMANTDTPIRPIEFLVLISVTASVLLVLSGKCLRLAVAIPLFGGFALIHGYAHGIQMSSEVSAIQSSRELVAAIGILLLMGVISGVGVRLLVRHSGWGNPALAIERETPP